MATTTYSDVDRLVARQHAIWNRMEEIRNAALTENRDWTAEERTNWDAANADLDTVSGDIDRLTRHTHLDTTQRGAAVEPGGPEVPEVEARDEEAERDARYASAFEEYMRGGMERVKPEDRSLMWERQSQENRAQSIATPSAGGYLVPSGFRDVLIETLKAYGGVINHAQVLNTSTGNTLSWPTIDDTSNTGAILAENTQISAQDMTFGTKSVGAYTYTSKLVLVSIQLLQDNVFDLNSFLPRKLGERIGRAVATDLVNGTGVGQPTGLLPSSTQGVTVANATFIGASPGGYNALLDLEHSVDPAYRVLGDNRFYFNDATLKIVRKFVDSQNRPLYLPVPVPGAPATINGNPYTIDQAFPNVSAGNKSIVFGNLQSGFLVRQALDVQAIRLTERYADFLQVGFFGFMRIDSTPNDPSAYKHLVTS